MEGVTFVDLETCFRDADVVSLHCPQTSSNTGFVNRDLLKTMKSTALLINVSRGPLIVDEDLAHALNHDIIDGAALDVLSKEPPLKDNLLLQAKNCIVTPHVAWATQSARARLLKMVGENINAYLQGKPQNVVSHQ
jgi:glycerate dehydrogenase